MKRWIYWLHTAPCLIGSCLKDQAWYVEKILSGIPGGSLYIECVWGQMRVVNCVYPCSYPLWSLGCLLICHTNEVVRVHVCVCVHSLIKTSAVWASHRAVEEIQLVFCPIRFVVRLSRTMLCCEGQWWIKVSTIKKRKTSFKNLV